MAVVNKIMKTFNVQNGSDTIRYEIFDAAGRRSIAPDWYENSTSAFSVGDFVMKDGVLYQFISPHAANTPWDASEVEAASIASSMSGKADKVDNATSGNFAGLDSNGNLTDSGHKHSDYLTEHQDISGKLNVSEKGAANGVAELDSNGKVPSSQLPSYVDDVVEGYYYDGKFYMEASHTTEIPAEDGKIYIDIEENKTYRWSGSIYVAIGGDLTLGETSSTAYRGDRGKAAYDHASDPNKISSQQTSGFYKVAVTAEGHVQSVSAVQKSDITDLGIPGSHQDISGKADKDTDAVTGNFAEFDANGNPVDSGHKHSDYASQQDLSGKISSTEKGVANGVATLGADGKVPSTQLPAGQTTISKIEMNGAEVPISSAGVADLGTVITQHQDISGKADKVSNATNGNFAGLNSAGNLTDSGVGASDFLPVDQGSTNAGKFMRVGNTGAVSYDSPTERYASTSQFPATGDSGKLYIAEDTGMIYVWETNDYSSVGGSDIPDFTGATSSAAGSHGLVPAPTTSDRNKFLKGDGTWGEAGTGNVYGDTIDMSSSDSTKVATAIGNKLDANQGSANAGKFMKVGNDGGLVPDTVPDPTGKADKVQNATSGNFAGLDANGNLTDSGSKASDFLTQHQDITGKADKVSGATTGNFAGLDANGNLTDSGSKASDFLTQHQDISGKADKVSNATSGNFAGLDANGNLTDSGSKASDFLTQHQDISGKADKVSNATSGNFAGLDSNGNLTDSGSKASDFLTQHQDISGKVDKNQGVAYAGKALGINDQGMVEPVEFSGTDFTGATGTTAGTHGLVPAPAAGDNTKYLMGDGTWQTPGGGTLRVVPFSIGVASWTLANNVYSYTVSSAYVTATSVEFIEYDSSFRAAVRGDVNATKATGGGGVVFTTDVLPVATLSGEIRVFDSDDGKVAIVTQMTALPTMREVPFTITASQWALNADDLYEAVFTTAFVTATSHDFVEFDESIENATDGIKVAKAESSGSVVGMKFLSRRIPAGSISGTITPLDNADGKIAVVLEDTVMPISNGGTGANTLQGAKDNLGITALENRFVKLWENQSPTSEFAGQSILFDRSGYEFLLIFYYYGSSTANNLEISNLVRNDDGKKWLQIGSSTSITGGRTVTLSDSGATISNATYNNNTDNRYIIPVCIYGVKN